MRILWTEPARSDINAIWDYLMEHQAPGAERVASDLLRSVERLELFPHSGRPDRIEGTRELILPGLPWLVVYAPAPSEIVILRVIHAARDMANWDTVMSGSTH